MKYTYPVACILALSYIVHIDFKRGPSFSVNLVATSAEAAISQATKDAISYGFDQPVKKAKAIPA